MNVAACMNAVACMNAAARINAAARMGRAPRAGHQEMLPMLVVPRQAREPVLVSGQYPCPANGFCTVSRPAEPPHPRAGPPLQ